MGSDDAIFYSGGLKHDLLSICGISHIDSRKYTGPALKGLIKMKKKNCFRNFGPIELKSAPIDQKFNS